MRYHNLHVISHKLKMLDMTLSRERLFTNDSIHSGMGLYEDGPQEWNNQSTM